MWVRSPVYFYKRNDTFYFSRAVPYDLRSRFHKPKIEVPLRTKSEAALSDRLGQYWDSLRMEMIYSRELEFSNQLISRVGQKAKSLMKSAAHVTVKLEFSPVTYLTGFHDPKIIAE